VPELLGVPVETVTEIEGGWDHAVFEVNGEWIVRVPRRKEVRPWLRKETRLLPEIAPLLPLPVPSFEVAEDGDEPFVAYRKLPGRPIDETLRDGADATALGRMLGSFLTALQRFDLARATELTDSGPDAHGWIEEQRRLHELSRSRVYPLLTAEEHERTDRLFRDFLEIAERDIAPTLVHADLGPDHLLCVGDRVTGVIDWSDAWVGDPAVDLAWLTNATPARFSDALVSACIDAGSVVTESTIKRSGFYHRVGPLHEILNALDTADTPLRERGLRGFRERLP
jgi:aminoglycoside phosphotransferase (APT) family kinase protein